MTKRTRRYTPEFKREAVELALTSPFVLSAAKALGMPEATLHTWVQQAKRSGEMIDPTTALSQTFHSTINNFFLGAIKLLTHKTAHKQPYWQHLYANL